MRKFASFLAAVSVAAALGLAAGPARADVKAGVDAWQRGDFAAAVGEWRPLADQGDADAQYNMGQAYKLGRGVTQDIDIAQSWYEKAAQQGHPQAAANLGLILFQKGEKQKAMPWLKMAADADDFRAEYVLGTALFNGDIAGKDWVRAYALMSRSAAQGFTPAVNNLQQMDQYVPEGQRRQGLALAREIEHNVGSAGRVVRAVPNQPGPRTVLPPNTALASTLPADPPARRPETRPATDSGEAPPPVSVHRGPPASVSVHHGEARPSAEPRHAPAAVAASEGRWRIQLGAFSSAANAHRAWESVRGKGLGGLRPIFTASGAMTRLQAGPLAGKAEAEKACAAAKAAGSACFPVAP
ncbi:MAG TPA: SPOR domain-containing protein [Allosphingosinicella sp.]|jgi:cell division septation protein DedD